MRTRQIDTLHLFKYAIWVLTRLIVVSLAIILASWIGMEMEQYQFRRLPGTLSFYETEEVCALDNVPIYPLQTQYEHGRTPTYLIAQTLPNCSVAHFGNTTVLSVSCTAGRAGIAPTRTISRFTQIRKTLSLIVLCLAANTQSLGQGQPVDACRNDSVFLRVVTNAGLKI